MTQDLGFHLFHITAFLLATAIFSRAIYLRLKIVSMGRPVDLASIKKRNLSVFYNVILQQKLFQHPLRGAMHAFIFYGFVVYVVHTAGQMVAGNLWTPLVHRGVDPYEFHLAALTAAGLSLPAWIGPLLLLATTLLAGATLRFKMSLDHRHRHDPEARLATSVRLTWILLAELLIPLALLLLSGPRVYEAAVRFVSVFVLLGLLYFAYRRWIRHAKGLDVHSPQSVAVILLIATLMLSTLAQEGAHAYLSGAPDDPIDRFFAWLLAILGMHDDQTALAVRDFSWWLHIVTVYAFMVYIPSSKHAHLIFAPVNYWFIKDEPRGKMSDMDLEDEKAVWGAANLTDLPRTSILDGLSCIECGRCTIQCPANRTGKPLDPKRIMVQVKHALTENMASLLSHTKSGSSAMPGEGKAGSSGGNASGEGAGEGLPTAPLMGDDRITDEELWGCTSCLACVEACPVGNNQWESIYEMRRNLVLAESRFEPTLQNAFVNMEKNSNPWGVGAHSRADWAEGLGVKTMAEHPDAEILYWVGCAGSFDERNKKIARSFVKILQTAGVDFAILGTEENCTGDSARRAGNEYLYQMLALTNVETMNRYGVKKIVTACPHCFNTLKNEYPSFGGNYEVHHHTRFIESLLQDGRLSGIAGAAQGGAKIAYHDSCYLGRHNEILDEPREILRQSGAVPVEACDHGSRSLCCGAGGAQMWMEETHEKVNMMRSRQLLDTGADGIATACPFCMIMIHDGVKASDTPDVPVLDIAEIVAERLG